jgi:hypothetical protein
MGNTGGRINAFRDSWLGPNCCEWVTTSFLGWIPIFLWRLVVFFFWLLIQVFLFIATVIFVLWRLAEQFVGTWEIPVIGVPIPAGPMFLFLYSGVFLFFFWFLFPTLIPFFRDVMIPFLNLALELFCFVWNLDILLWNLYIQIWDGLVPLIGMLIYIIMDVFETILTEVFSILGSIDIMSIFRPFMEILQFLVNIATEIVQAIITVAKPLFQILITIIGALIKVVMAVVQILFPIVQWVVGLLFKLLEPILQVVIDLVQWFLDLFAALSAASSFAARMLSGLGDGPTTDTFQFQMYSDVNHAANKYWTPTSLSIAQRELSNINEFNMRNPLKPFDYYFTIVHPGYTRQALFRNYPNPYLGENYAAVSPGFGRALLEESRTRGLLSAEEYEDLTTEPLKWDDKAWEMYDQNPTQAHQWFEEQSITQTHRKQQLMDKVLRKLFEADKANATAPHPMMSESEWYQERHRRIASEQQQPHRFADKMKKKIKCQSLICGGKGKAMDFPIHTLRKKVERRFSKPMESPWKLKTQTEDEYMDQKFIHGSAAIHAVHEGSEKFFGHMMNPKLHRATAKSFQSVTGHDTFQGAYEQVYSSYSDSYHMLHEWIPKMHDWPAFRALADQDPDKHTRMWYGDWLKTVRVRERIRSDTGRKTLELELDPLNNPEHRRLLELARYDWSYSVVDTGDQSTYQFAYTPKQFAGRELEGIISGYSIGANGGSFPSNPPVSISNQSSARGQIDNRTSDTASLPLFDLLTETDCYTTHPRNPLCLPEIPQALVIGTCPVLSWPANATGQDFCNYLFCPSPRNLLDWRAYISWCRIWNGVKMLLFFLAYFPILTSTIGIIIERFPWLGWALKWLLVFPPGHTPDEIDWICWVMHLYDAWLDIFISYLLWLLVFPFFEYAVAVYLAFIGLYETYSMIDAQRAERIANTSVTMTRLAFDSALNRGEAYYNDPSYFRYQRGIDERKQTSRWATRDRFGGRGAPGPSPGTSSWLPVQAQTPYERYEATNPYVMNKGGDQFSIPWLDNYRDRNTPYLQDGASGNTLIGHELEEIMQRQRPIAAGRQEEAQPQQPPGVAELEAEFQAKLEEADASIGRLESLLHRCALLFGMPRLRCTYGDLVRFESAHRMYLHSYQFSLWWMFQRINSIVTQRRIRHRETPINGVYREGFSSWWMARTPPPKPKRRPLSPEEIV